MKMHAYYLSCLFLFAFSFGIAATAAYSQEDAVIAQGNPPLTQSMFAKTIVLLEWSLDIKFSEAQKAKVAKAMIGYWKANNRAEMDNAVEIAKVVDGLMQAPAEDRNKAKEVIRAKILQGLRNEPDDEISRLVIEAYEAVQSGNSKTTQQSNSSPTTTTWNKQRVGADGFTGIYRMVRPKAINVNSTMPGSGYTIEYITFLPDGYVFWRLPSEGLLYFDPQIAQRAYPNDWGTYEVKNGEIHVMRGPDRRKYVITRSGERLNNPASLGKGSFRPVPPADRLRLEGTYRWSENTPAITFTKDGNFRDEGFYTQPDSVSPDGTFYKRDTRGGSGTYVIEQNTLELRYSDGRVKRFPFIVFQEQLAQAPALDSFILYYNDVIKRY
jgi:hypothetical protein